ncbi:ribosome biogenesis protein NOP53 isoform X1 [Hydra vulgaris]|uniref:ribosome biogenesis protein NOP53 isoform X1 n=1 Tax=Hydra vulgaris TaxID=6087 RepID=UPI0002B4571A|nr:ribosome biogenesis protein NOP53 [Hydra vulgaris]
MVNMAGIKTHKYKGSKKSKKSWRKHTDIADVEEHLDNVRREERTGGLLENKSDESIFFHDKVIKGVPDRSGVKKKVAENDEEEDDDEETYVSQKERQKRKQDIEAKKEEEQAKKERNKQIHSIWGQEKLTVVDAYIEPAIKKAKIKPKTVGKGKADIKAVLTPEPGTSYNPDYDSHQNLLKKAYDAQMKKMIEEQKLNDKVKMVSVDELKKQTKLWLKEMSEGLNFHKSEDNDDHLDDSSNQGTIKLSSKKRVKTSKMRKREKLNKIEDRKKIEMKVAKVIMNDVFRIKTLKKEIREEEKKIAERMKQKSEKMLQTATRTKRLSKYKFEDPEIAFNLSEELAPTLREMKPDGNLLIDNFKSLQRRNIIEPRKPVVPKRRSKRKIYTKKSYLTPTIKDINLNN